jgi:hypothetical protein
VFFLILIQISDDTMSTEARQEGESAQDPFGKTMTPWIFDIKFPLGTQFTFRSLTFAAGRRETSRCCPRASARASRSGSFIYIGQCLLRFRPFYRAIHPHHQARSGYSDRDVHPLTIRQSISLVPRLRLI